MKQYLRDNVKTVAGLVAVLAVLGFLTYSFTAPGGMFSGLPNDLRAIEPEEGAGYTTLDGVPVELTDFKGRPLIVNSWATWMPFSRDELMLLSALQAEYGESVTILGINRMEDPLTIRAYFETYGIKVSIRVLLDPQDSFYRAVDGYAMPETVFYQKDGTMLAHTRGVLTEAELRANIETLLR